MRQELGFAPAVCRPRRVPTTESTNTGTVCFIHLVGGERHIAPHVAGEAGCWGIGEEDLNLTLGKENSQEKVILDHAFGRKHRNQPSWGWRGQGRGRELWAEHSVYKGEGCGTANCST